ncbi:DegV family protein, partial [SAR202 cluster bacterium AD-802-E10_MRT_200m]|nr:DegV family protein [SAR202 cluster bacterium AD-802-E10_MRT_200m]
MTVQIVTDSGADVPKDLIEQLNIEVVPLTVSFGNETFQDGVDISGDEFYYRLTQEEIMPTTSQPSVGSFVEVYKKIKDSSNEILSIHISSKLSGTLNSAQQAVAEEGSESGIRLIDSQAASMGLGFSVLAAAEAAKNGASLEEAAEIAASVLDR